MADFEEAPIIIEVQVEEVIATSVDMEGPAGPAGAPGRDGWSAVYAIEADGARRVLKLVNWTGGTGAYPAGLGMYLGPTGLVVDIADGADVRGAIGAPGVQGEPGAPGAVLVGDGANIETQPRDPVFPDDGTNGDLWINSISGDVFSRTLTAWDLQGNIIGPQGPAGVAGDDGVQGLPGADGDDGWSPSLGLVADGARQVIRLLGYIGGQGSPPTANVGAYMGNGTWTSNIALAVNIRGNTGTAGADGVIGSNGLSTYILPGPPSAGLGRAGESYIDQTSLVLYRKNAGSPDAWAAVGTIKGADSTVPGPQGAQGPQGLQGAQGPVGAASTVPGPQGDKGDTGDAGPQGAASTVAGPQGAQGFSIISGVGIPGAGVGVNGDTYVNRTNGDVYGPKTAGAWGAISGSVRGPTGTAGADSTVPGPQGYSFRYGSGAPSNALGINNDTYLQTEGFIIWVKSAGAWSSVGSINGTNGTPGADGTDGADGTNGTNGTNGYSFRYGAGAPSNLLGNDNDTYLNTSNFHIYVKGAGAWTDVGTIVGPQGIQGVQGVQGVQGNAGNTGAAGASILAGTGAPGAGVGANGDTYVDKATGNVYGPKAAGAWPAFSGNIKGPQGDAGTAGTNGATITSGTAVPTGGANGDLYVRTSNYDLYKNTAGVWAVIGNIKGADLIGAADLSAFLPGKPTSSQLFFRHRVVRAFTWPVNLAGSRAAAGVAATAAYVITIAKNGTAIGTLSWAAAGTVPTIAMASAQTFVAGTDIITFTGQATVDATLADIDFNLLGSR